MPRIASVFAALVGLMSDGCGSTETPPTTYEVKGRVVVKAGNQVLKQGSVAFIHRTDAQLNARGEIDEEGKFTLFTFSGNKKLPGATPGAYQVTVSLPQGADHRGHSKTLPAPYQVEAKENFFEIVLERMP